MQQHLYAKEPTTPPHTPMTRGMLARTDGVTQGYTITNLATSSPQYDYEPGPPKSFGLSVVELHNVGKRYKLQSGAKDDEEGVVALHSIHLRPGTEFPPVRQGEFVMILGPSGGGKTTLLNMIGTIDLPTEGSILLRDDSTGKIETITKDSPDGFLSDLRLRSIGFVFQTFNLIATMSAFENVELPMTLAKVKPKERKQRARALLRLVGLQDRANHLPSELSGGEQQRTTIARALANNPSLLLLDEPTGDLDTFNTVSVMNLLLQINREAGTTLIMVTHNPDLECYADRILHVRDGKFVRQVWNKHQVELDFDRYNHYLNSTSNH